MDLSLNTTFSFFLTLTRDYVVFPFIILGMVFVDRRLFLRSAVLILFGCILNAYLKSIFQVPVKSHLSLDWWAFPSGHAQFAGTLYGYLAYKFPTQLVCFTCVIIIAGISCALVYFNYHDGMDVFAGLAVAGAWIIFFDKLDGLFKDRLFLLSGLLFLGSCFLLSFIPKRVSTFPLILGSHGGLTMGLALDYFLRGKSLSKGKELLLIVGGAIVLYGILYIIPLPKPYHTYVLYGMIVGWAVTGPRLLVKRG